MDLRYKYETGDMVEFTLTAYNSPKVYRGVITERWKSKIKYVNEKFVLLYKVNCLEKEMRPFTVSEVLIIGKV